MHYFHVQALNCVKKRINLFPFFFSFSEFYLGFLIFSRIKNSPQYLYMVVWNGIVYNSVTEWIKSDSNESPEEAVAKVRDALKLLSDTMSSENNKSN